MAFLDLPNEIIMDIAGFLDATRDINSMCRMNRRIFTVLNGLLYRHSINAQQSSALFWAAHHDRVYTARRIIHFGANVNICRRSIKGMSGSNLTALHIAAWKGHLATVKVLLDAGADPEAKVKEGFTPLYLALTGRHVKVARTISSRIGNLQTCLVHHRRLYTPLHVSAFMGLPSCVRFFLNAGADVDARDIETMTPLNRVLMRDNRWVIDVDIFGGIKREQKGPPFAEDLLETVEILLEFHANPDIEVQPSATAVDPPTARERGQLHWLRPIRALFAEDDTFEDDYYPSSEVQIGRPWMPSLLPESSQALVNTSTLEDEMDAEDVPATGHHILANTIPAFSITPESFPSLGARQALLSDPRKPITRGPWSGSRQYSEQFPSLNSQSSNASSKPNAGPVQTYSEKAKGSGPAGLPLFISERIASESSRSENRRGKAGKKPRWQPVKI